MFKSQSWNISGGGWIQVAKWCSVLEMQSWDIFLGWIHVAKWCSLLRIQLWNIPLLLISLSMFKQETLSDWRPGPIEWLHKKNLMLLPLGHEVNTLCVGYPAVETTAASGSWCPGRRGRRTAATPCTGPTPTPSTIPWIGATLRPPVPMRCGTSEIHTSHF